MKKLLAFTTVASDTVDFQAGTTIHAGQRFELYRDHIDRDDDDVTKQEEEQILRWILSSSAREFFFQELGIKPNPFVALSVRHPVIEHGHFKPGDIPEWTSEWQDQMDYQQREFGYFTKPQVKRLTEDKYPTTG